MQWTLLIGMDVFFLFKSVFVLSLEYAGGGSVAIPFYLSFFGRWFENV